MALQIDTIGSCEQVMTEEAASDSFAVRGTCIARLLVFLRAGAIHHACVGLLPVGMATCHFNKEARLGEVLMYLNI